MRLKVTLIGAGSVIFAKNLIGDILQLPELQDCLISLMDIDAARLRVAETMTRKMVAHLGLPTAVEATTDRKEAIRGARYVICTVQVGGYRPGTVLDFEIPRKYGLRQTIGDTLGVGGVFRALRTIPVLIGIAQDIADVGADGCLLLNYSNPMAMNCMAVDWAVGVPHVGLCHSVQGTAQQLASYANLPSRDLSYLVAGINHMAFFLRFEYRGQDAYPLLFRLLDDPAFKHDRVRFEMMRRTGFFVTESSEHQAEYVPYFIHHGPEVIEAFGVPLDEYLRRCEAILGSWKQTERDLLGSKGAIRVNPPTHEYGAYIIHSRETHLPRVIYGNVPNDGLIDNLPGDCCVEVPCLVDRNGIQPTQIGVLPPQLAALCQSNINVQTLAVEAALTGKREHIYHAVMVDPHTSASLQLDQIWKMCDELIEAHQKVGLLDDFEPALPNTGRAWHGTGDRAIAEIEFPDLDRRPGARNALIVSIHNPGRRAITPRLILSARSGEATFPNGPTLTPRVPPGKTIKKKVPIVFPQGLDSTVDIALNSPADVLCLGTAVEPRLELDCRKNQTAEFSMSLAGVSAVEGRLSSNEAGFELNLIVRDSAVSNETPRQTPWQGSCIELFLALPGRKSVPTQFFIVPQKGKATPLVLNRDMETVKEISAKTRFSTISYQLDIRFPLSMIPRSADSRIVLFDLLATLQALGDAHSGGRAALNGNFESYRMTRHYALVRF